MKLSDNAKTNLIGSALAGALGFDALTPEQLGTIVDLAGRADWKQIAVAAALFYVYYRMGKKNDR